MGKTADALSSLKVGDSFAFMQNQKFIVEAEIKSCSDKLFVIRNDFTEKSDWRVWRAE